MSMNELFGGGKPQKWVSGTYQEGTFMWSPSDFQIYMNKTTGVRATDPASDPTNWMPSGERAIKSIQRGTVTFSGVTSATVTISSVVVSKSELRFLGFSTSATDSLGCPRIDLTNSTTITANKGTAAFTTTVSWELTERY